MHQLLCLHVAVLLVVIEISQIGFVVCWPTPNKSTTTTTSSNRRISSSSSSVSQKEWLQRTRKEEGSSITTTINMNMKRKYKSRLFQRYFMMERTEEEDDDDQSSCIMKDEFDYDSSHAILPLTLLQPSSRETTSSSLSKTTTNVDKTRREFIVSPIPALVYSTSVLTSLSSSLPVHQASASSTANAFDVVDNNNTPTTTTTNHNEDDDDNISLLGPLAYLIGTWTGNNGVNIVSVPSRKSKPTDPGKFELIVQRPYREVLTFKKLPDEGVVRNRGGDYDQYIGAIEYKQEVYYTKDTADVINNPDDEQQQPAEELIHIENGMFFYLDNIQKYESNGSINISSNEQMEPKQKYTIARSATIPHGNSALLVGYYKEEINNDKSPPTPTMMNIPDISTLPRNIGMKAPKEYINPYLKPIDYTNPNSVLQKKVIINDDITTNHNKKLIKTIHISLDSNYSDDDDVTEGPANSSSSQKKTNHHHHNGVQSIPFLIERADTTRFKSDFWIEFMEDGTKQLQYSQIIDIAFHKPIVGGSGGGGRSISSSSSSSSKGNIDPNYNDDNVDDDDRIIWPHVTVNTLQKID